MAPAILKQGGSTRARPWAVAALAMAFASLLPPGGAVLRAGQVTPAESLSAIEVAPEGRLLRITLKASTSIDRYTLARQGPPEKRDLVVRFPGLANATPGPADTGDYLLNIQVSADAPGEKGLMVVIERAGDSLVSVAQDGASLSLVIIPPEKRSDAVDAYRIGVNDTLQVDVFGHEDLNKTLKVSPHGSINVPLIGAVRAEGRTVDEVAQEITEKLAADYLRDPHVSVSVWEYLSQWVNVIGEVAQPGRFALTGPTSLIDVLSQAGGLTPKAAGEITVTRRADEVDPAAAGQVFHVQVEQLFAGVAKLNMRMRQGDVIHVPAALAAAGHP